MVEKATQPAAPSISGKCPCGAVTEAGGQSRVGSDILSLPYPSHCPHLQSPSLKLKGERERVGRGRG